MWALVRRRNTRASGGFAPVSHVYEALYPRRVRIEINYVLEDKHR